LILILKERALVRVSTDNPERVPTAASLLEFFAFMSVLDIIMQATAAVQM